MSIYIAIATMGNQDNINRLLSTEFWQSITPDVELIYILSQTGHIRLNPRRGLAIEYSASPLGCAGARQKMVDYFFARGLKPDDVIIFLDDDIEVLSSQWLQRLIAPLYEGYHLAGVEGRKLTKKMPKIEAKNFDYLSGGWLAARGEVFTYKCRFDTQFNPNYWEDADLGMQAKQHGFKMKCVGSIGLKHDETLKDGQTALLETNRAKFYAKWGLE